jgi:hypothetical protein
MNDEELMIFLVKPQGNGPMLAIQANSVEEYQAMMAECRKDYPTVKFSTPEVMTPSEYKRRYK